MTKKAFNFDKWLLNFCRETGSNIAAIETVARQLLLDNRAKSCESGEAWLNDVSGIKQPQPAERKVTEALWKVLHGEEVSEKPSKPTSQSKEQDSKKQ